MNINPQELLGKILNKQQEKISDSKINQIANEKSVFEGKETKKLEKNSLMTPEQIEELGGIQELLKKALENLYNENDNLDIKKQEEELTPEQKENVEIFAQGEKWAQGSIITLMGNPPGYTAKDGKIYSNYDDALNANRDLYAQEHPEYAKAREEGEKALEEHQRFIEEKMAKYDEENGTNPNLGTLQEIGERDEYLAKIEEQYRQENPYYKAIDDAINSESIQIKFK